MPKESDSWWRSGLGGGGTADDFYPGSHLEIRQLNVSVLKECDTYPSLESDESCEYEGDCELSTISQNTSLCMTHRDPRSHAHGGVLASTSGYM